MRGMLHGVTGLLLASVAFAQDASLAEGEKSMASGEYAAALIAFEKAIQEAPEDARGHAGRAAALEELGRDEEALASIQRAIELAPKPDAHYLHIRAVVRFKRGDEAAAFADIAKAMEIDPRRGVLYQVRAFMLVQKYDYEGALRDYSKALKLNPRGLSALEGRAQAKELLRDWKGAVEDYTLLGKATWPHPRPFQLRADVRRRLGEWKAAIADYDATICGDGKNAQAYLGRARARIALGDREAADADAAKAVEADPSADTFAERGRYYYDTGRLKEAVADLAKAVQMDPKWQDVTRLFLFLARAQSGERDAAAAELKAYIDVRERKDDWYAKGALFLCGKLKEGDFFAAGKVENKHHEREHECGGCWYAGALRLLDGDAAGAKALFERCIATDLRNTIEYESAKMALAGMK